MKHGISSPLWNQHNSVRKMFEHEIWDGNSLQIGITPSASLTSEMFKGYIGTVLIQVVAANSMAAWGQTEVEYTRRNIVAHLSISEPQ
jgi:hypothetical protein